MTAKDIHNIAPALSSGRQLAVVRQARDGRSEVDRARSRAHVAASAWGRRLEPGQIDRAAAALVEHAVPAGGYAIRKGQPVTHWIGVIDGLIKMAGTSPEGKTVTFAGIAPGGWFGEGSLLKDRVWKYDAIAIRASRVALLPRADYLHLLETSIPFNRFLIEQLNERLGHFIGLVEFDRLLGPDARVARCIASLFNPRLYPNVRESLAISQEEIGYLCALSRQRVNQALRLLVAAKLVVLDYGKLTVLDLDGLHSYGQ